MSNQQNRIELVDKKLDFFVDAIKEEKKITFSRWGDVEFYLALKKFSPNHPMMKVYNQKKTNKSGHHLHFPQATTKLLSILLAQKKYIWAMGKLSNKNWGDAISNLFKTYSISHEWYDVDVFLRPNCNGELWPLVEQLRNMKILYVGPDHIINNALNEVLGKNNFIGVEVPATDCLLAEEDAFTKIRTILHKENVDLICFSCSMLANILIDRLYDFYDCSVIDFGSIWDIYAGVKSRSFFVNMDNWDDLILRNLNKA